MINYISSLSVYYPYNNDTKPGTASNFQMACHVFCDDTLIESENHMYKSVCI